MNIFVLYDKSGIYSGRVLGKYLIKHLYGKAKVQRGRPKRLEVLQKKGEKFDFIINVGWFKAFDAKGATVLNVPAAITASSNKRRARKTFTTQKIPAPKLWLNYQEVSEKDCPVVGRTTHHSKGGGFWFCKNLKEVRSAARAGASHFLRFIPNTREFRVHVMAPKPELDGLKQEDYLVIKLSEKIPHPGAKPNEIIKNHDNGWFFGYPKNRKEAVLSKVREVGRQTLATFGLHWGAVDVMLSRDTGELYVLEVNSSPCLTDDSANTLDKYASGILVMLGLQQPKPKKSKVKNPTPKKTKIKGVAKKNRNEKLKSFLSKNKLL